VAENELVIMPLDPKDPGESKPLRIRRGRVESVDLYEIKDSELDLLEKGSPADLQLNFSIFLLSSAVTALCSFATATFTSKTAENVFILGTIVGLLLGVYLLLAWWRNKTSLKSVADRIRQRIPPEVLPASAIRPEEQPGGQARNDPGV
jgi:hypothetical protein